MLKEMECTGKNQEEAIARALAQLGLERDDVSVEILELGKTGFLGIGSVPARVKVTYEAPDEPEPVSPPAAPTQPETAPAPAREERAPRPASPAPAAPAPARGEADGESGDVQARITAFLDGLLERMGTRAQVQVTRNGDVWNVVLQGESLGALIGRRGETLDAIQQLTGYAVNQGRAKRSRIHLDAEHYRARREESLRRLAAKVAGKVARYRRSVTLEPMNAYERHVIHAALQDCPGVSTHSTGTEPNRRVVVAYDPDQG